MSRQQAYWLCQGIGWGLYVAFNLLLSGIFAPLGLYVVLGFVLSGALGLGLTHAYRQYVKRRAWDQMGLLALVPRVLAASIGIALVMTVFGAGFGGLMAGEDAPPFQWGIAFAIAFNLSATILLWSLIYFGLHAFWNYKAEEVARWRLEAAVKDAELRALKAQLNPHFLFNSLNSVRALIADDPAQAQDAVTHLSALLRYALRASQQTTVPLHEELDTVRTYLTLEHLRFDERLAYTITCTPAVREVPIPTMLVQTLVENAIKHGLGEQPEGGEIAVDAAENGESAAIRVANTGTLGAGTPGTGVGLQNAQERLRLLYGTDASLSLRQDGPLVVAEVRLPLATSN